LGCNTFVHGSNARNLSVLLSLSQLAKTLCLPYYVYVFSLTKLEIRAEQVLPRSEGQWGEGEGRGQGGEMTQTMYAYVNTLIIKKTQQNVSEKDLTERPETLKLLEKNTSRHKHRQ
jgi:hypothetical protein